MDVPRIARGAPLLPEPVEVAAQVDGDKEQLRLIGVLRPDPALQQVPMEQLHAQLTAVSWWNGSAWSQAGMHTGLLVDWKAPLDTEFRNAACRPHSAEADTEEEPDMRIRCCLDSPPKTQSAALRMAASVLRR